MFLKLFGVIDYLLIFLIWEFKFFNIFFVYVLKFFLLMFILIFFFFWVFLRFFINFFIVFFFKDSFVIFIKILVIKYVLLFKK